MIKTFKIAISVPKYDYERIEAMRRKLRLGRSAAIVQAIESWLAKFDEQEMIRRYEAGYKRKPENLGEIKAMEQAAAEAFEEEGWQ